MQKIIPHLWFDKEAKQAAEFYASVFPDGKILNVTTLHDTPSGDADTVSFELAGYRMMAISAGPYFKINPSISFFLNFDPSRDPDARTKLDEMWAKLSEGGQPLMALDTYPFSERYGWIQDKFGVSWQLILSKPEGEARPFIVPSLLFTQARAGKAEEAAKFYVSVFHDAKMGQVARYPEGSAPDKPGTVMFEDFALEDQWFSAMDSAHPHAFTFNEGISLMVFCKDQAEIDFFWERLSADPSAEQCGWCKDKFGVSWQVTPAEMQEMLATGTPYQVARVTKAFLPMKKFDLAALRKAFEGN